MLALTNATLYTPTEGIQGASLLIDGERIAAVNPPQALIDRPGVKTLDLQGGLLVPGFIDLQINGAFGQDFTANPGSIWEVAASLPRYGVTAFLPTVITSPLETIARAQAVLQQGSPPGWRGARPLGLHVEGPFLNPERKGAHNPAHLRPPSLDDYADLSPATGVRLVTLAPELPGAEAVIRALVERGVIVSAGHSQATYAQAIQAFDWGVSYNVHLFNAMSPLNHFEPGLVGALLDDPRPTVGIIPDGVHVHPAALRCAWRNTGPARLNLVTDAMAALGMPPGEYVIGDLEVVVDATSARLRSGALAGSIISLDQCLRNLLRFTGCGLGEALQTITLTPARLLRLDNEIGQVSAGRRADLLHLDKDLQVLWTMVGGEIVYTCQR